MSCMTESAESGHAIVVLCQVHFPVCGWDSILFPPPILNIPVS